MKVILNPGVINQIPQNEYITAEEIINMVNEKLDKKNFTLNAELFMTTCKTILTDVYRNYKLYIDVYSDLKKVYVNSRLKRVEFIPYYVRIAAYKESSCLCDEAEFFYQTEKSIFSSDNYIRNYRIIDVDEAI